MAILQNGATSSFVEFSEYFLLKVELECNPRVVGSLRTSDLEDRHEGVQAVHVERVHLVKISDNKVEQAASPGDVPVFLG